MPNKRDDFTEATKRKMASRVGYICSKPDCNAFTIGASFEGNDKTSVTGVAAHICAAAPGGKRYDPSMTSEERKSIENGIWLCQTHARLIDTDESTYTVELLKEWKKTAEKQASQRLADGNFISNYYNEHGNDFSALIAIMKNCVCEGNFSTLLFIISNYRSDLGEDYNELILRYKIVYCAYCDRSKLQKYLNKYMKLSNKDGADELAELFISLHLIIYLKQIIKFINNTKIKDIAQLVITNQFADRFLLRTAEEKKPSFKYDGNANFILKHLSYHIYTNNYFELMDETGNLYTMYRDEFFYECLFISFEMTRVVIKLTDDSITKYTDFIKNNLSKIKELDLELQEIIIDTVLKNLINYKDKFNYLYNEISIELKSRKKIIEDSYIYQIFHKLPIDEDELIQFCSENDDYSSLVHYVWSLDNDVRIDFLNKHQYLYERNVEFIVVRYKTFKDDIKELIDTYRELYSSVFSFVCIDVLEGNTEKIEWITSNLDSMKISDCSLYISILEDNNMFDELIKLSDMIKSNNALYNDLYRIGLILHNNDATVKKALDIYCFLESREFIPQGLLLNRGIIECKYGRIENAKSYLAKEYDKYKTPNALLYLLNTRYVNDQCINDKYLAEAKLYKDRADILGLVGATLSKLHDKNAYKYYLKSLLIDDSNESCLNAIFFDLNSIVSSDPKNVEENTVCFLSKDKETITIAIHEPQILEGITPNNFAGCKHYSSDDSQISNLMFRSVGEKINIYSKEYTLEKIESLTKFISKVALQSILNNPSTIAFTGNIEESIDKITKFMRNNSVELNKIVDDYNNSKVKLPLVSFSKMVGKSRLETLDFLYHQNKGKIPNNRNVLTTPVEKYVLSYEIIVIICKLNITDKLPGNVCLCCTQQVKTQMISDIDNELVMLSSKGANGLLVYHNDNLSMIDYDSNFKRLRHEFLTRLKKFLNSLNIVNNSDYISSQEVINQFFIDKKLLCEGTSLAAVNGNSNYCLVTDDQFVYNVANLDGTQNIGLCSFLTALNCDLSELLDILLELSECNYTYYITPELYDRCEDLIDNSDNKKEYYSKFKNFLITDRDKEKPTEYHSQLIFNLFREISQQDNRFIINNYPIIEIIRYHFSLLYPKEYGRMVKDAYRSLFFSSNDENNET